MKAGPPGKWHRYSKWWGEALTCKRHTLKGKSRDCADSPQ